MTLEDDRVKAHEAWLACDYDPAMPQPGQEDEEQGIDRFEDDSWYDFAYPHGEDGENAGGRDGDGHQFLFHVVVFFVGILKCLCKELFI